MIKTITVGEFLLTEIFNRTSPTFFDIESEDLYVKTSLIQLLQDRSSYLIRINNDEDEANMVDFLKDLYLIGFNLSYDLGTLRFAPKRLDDLFYAVKIAYPEIQKFSLDNVANYFKLNYYDGIDKKALQKNRFIRNAYLSQEQLRYASADTAILQRLWADPKIQTIIKDNLAYRLGRFSLEETMVWQNNGMPVLFDTVEKYRSKAQSEIARLRQELAIATGKDMNPRSSVQVKAH